MCAFIDIEHVEVIHDIRIHEKIDVKLVLIESPYLRLRSRTVAFCVRLLERKTS